MKKLTIFLFAAICSVLTVTVQAQDTIRSLVFSEWAGIGRYDAWFELTNMGTETLDLSDFTVANLPNGLQFTLVDGQYNANIALNKRLRLSGSLAPNESFLIMNVFDRLHIEGESKYEQARTDLIDGATYHRMDMMALADEIVHYDDILGGSGGVVDPARQIWDFDSTSVHNHLLRLLGGGMGNILFYHLPNGDSVIVDQVKMSLAANLKMNSGQGRDVAGVTNATTSHILVRKANVIEGNTDWDLARASSIETSEWMPVPNFTGKIYTTINTHGDFSIDMESSSIGINLSDSTLSVPWGILKGDSMINEFSTFGDGMGWQYIEDLTGGMDSAHVIAQNGDILSVFACGNDLEQIDFEITIAPPAADMAKVFPYRSWIPENENWGAAIYNVTDGVPGIDTIGGVAFATREDSLYVNLEKAPNASWELVWMDGIETADLKSGDKLKVTAEDGSTIKEYYISVNAYEANNNAFLSAITWPEKSEFLEGWMGDTIPSFAPANGQYIVTLPYGSTNVPALKAIPQDINAGISMSRAQTLKGSIEERTSTFVVLAEDGIANFTYNVIFEVEKDYENIQVYKGTPFFSELICNQNSLISYVEIANPGNVALDLSEYLLINSPSANPGDALAGIVPVAPTEADFGNRYMSYVPGYNYVDDTTGWILNAGKLVEDLSVNPVMEPGEVFVIGAANGAIKGVPRADPPYTLPETRENTDKLWWSSTARDETGTTTKNTFPNVKRKAEALYIFKIINAEVLNGNKAVGDPDDYELVDILGDVDPSDGIWPMAGVEINGGWKGTMNRKPAIYSGVTEIGDGMGTGAEDSDWIVDVYQGPNLPTWGSMQAGVGSHLMEVVTVYMSTISSTTYLVSDGYKDAQSVQGELNSTTVTDLYANINKADAAQVLSVLSNVDGAALDLTDKVSGNDTLVVVSADGLNQTKYVLVDAPLDSDAVIKVVDGQADAYTVSVDGSNGTITGTGVSWGTTVNDALTALEVPALATYVIIDGDGNLVPLKVLNTDNEYVETLLSDNIFIEVVAEDGVTKITYQFMPEAGSGEAFVVSTVYDVDQVAVIIANIADQTSVTTLMSNVVPVTGATMKVFNKAGFERSEGIVSYDDQLVVVSQDGSKTVNYYLNFANEQNPDVPNQAPVVSIVADASAAPDVAISVTADVTDDGQPEGSVLTYLWEVTAGDAGTVNIASPDQVTTDVTFSALGDFTLSLTVSDSDLETKASHDISVNAVGIGMFDMSAISIYPNPAGELVHVELGGASQVESQIRIMDITGRVAYLDRHFNSRVQINLDGFDAGIYFITIKVDSQSAVRKLNILK